jgi:hypothetical protein
MPTGERYQGDGVDRRSSTFAKSSTGCSPCSTSVASILPSGRAQLDALHDAGADLTAHMDLTQARRPGRVTQRVYVDFPEELLKAIDREARRIGVTRQAYIKLRLADTVAT